MQRARARLHTDTHTHTTQHKSPHHTTQHNTNHHTTHGLTHSLTYHIAQVFCASAPFGGYKMSGIGRELGEDGLFNYIEKKTVIMKMDPRARR